jgi:hypothetical protein
METSAKILVVGGVLNLVLAFVSGFALARVRLRTPEAATGYLPDVHRVTLWQGFMLLGLAFAAGLSKLPVALETAAASLLVAGTAFQAASSILNWIQGVRDQFADRSFGLKLATVNSVLASAGLAILVVGVFRGL